MDQTLTNQEELVGNMRPVGSLGYSDHEMVEVRILRGTSRANSRITTLDFWRADWNPFRDLFGKIPWETALERSPGELVGFQGSPPPCSRMVHAHKLKSSKASLRG